MAEPEKKKDAEAAEEPKPKKKIPTTLVLVVSVALIEAICFWGATKMFGGGPQTSFGEEGQPHVIEGEDTTSLPPTVEVLLLKKFQVPNDKRGRAYVYDFDIAIKAAGHREQEIKDLVEQRTSEISDRIARIVRGADPTVLHEAELKTLRMQIKHELGKLAGDQDAIIEVLIPRCVPIRSD